MAPSPKRSEAKPAQKAKVSATKSNASKPTVSAATPAIRPAMRKNIDISNHPMLLNFKKVATENPAMTVVGIVAVTLAIILMLN